MRRKDVFSNRHQPIDDLSTKGGHLLVGDATEKLRFAFQMSLLLRSIATLRDETEAKYEAKRCVFKPAPADR